VADDLVAVDLFYIVRAGDLGDRLDRDPVLRAAHVDEHHLHDGDGDREPELDRCSLARFTLD